MKEFYYIKLDAEYVLGLFQDAVDTFTKGYELEKWTDVIMDWYEEQLENDELDWGFSIPDLVRNDLLGSTMVGISTDNELFEEVDRLWKDHGNGYVGDVSDRIARVCYKSKDDCGNTCYLIQKEE
jgi:hypothetical protein